MLVRSGRLHERQDIVSGVDVHKRPAYAVECYRLREPRAEKSYRMSARASGARAE